MVHSQRHVQANLLTCRLERNTDTMNTIKNFLKDESGLELSEYAIAAALIAATIAAIFTQLGAAILTKITALKEAIAGS